MVVEVKDKIGLGIYEGEQLNFGIMPRFSSSTLTFNITSNKDVDVIIIKKGNISDFVTLSENKFYLQKNELKRVSTHINIPRDAKFGNYSGRLLIILRNV